MPTNSQKTYSGMLHLSTFEDRFEYVNLHGRVGELTHGAFRYLNQEFYTSREWRLFRNMIVERDDGCDLAIPNRHVHGPITIHHIVPVSVEMLVGHEDLLMDPNNVVCVSSATHNAIHYGSFETAPQDFEPRRPGDTTPWKRGIYE